MTGFHLRVHTLLTLQRYVELELHTRNILFLVPLTFLPCRQSPPAKSHFHRQFPGHISNDLNTKPILHTISFPFPL